MRQHICDRCKKMAEASESYAPPKGWTNLNCSGYVMQTNNPYSKKLAFTLDLCDTCITGLAQEQGSTLEGALEDFVLGILDSRGQNNG